MNQFVLKSALKTSKIKIGWNWGRLIWFSIHFLIRPWTVDTSPGHIRGKSLARWTVEYYIFYFFLLFWVRISNLSSSIRMKAIIQNPQLITKLPTLLHEHNCMCVTSHCKWPISNASFSASTVQEPMSTYGPAQGLYRWEFGMQTEKGECGQSPMQKLRRQFLTAASSETVYKFSIISHVNLCPAPPRIALRLHMWIYAQHRQRSKDLCSLPLLHWLLVGKSLVNS